MQIFRLVALHIILFSVSFGAIVLAVVAIAVIRNVIHHVRSWWTVFLSRQYPSEIKILSNNAGQKLIEETRHRSFPSLDHQPRCHLT